MEDQRLGGARQTANTQKTGTEVRDRQEWRQRAGVVAVVQLCAAESAGIRDDQGKVIRSERGKQRLPQSTAPQRIRAGETVGRRSDADEVLYFLDSERSKHRTHYHKYLFFLRLTF